MDRREALKLSLLAGVGLAAGSAQAQQACAADGTPAQFTPKEAADARPLENELDMANDVAMIRKMREDIAAIWVTDFYNLQPIDARKAWYVIGSDVMGPMGHELVPLASKEDAADVLKDHKGRRILSFEQVTLDLVLKLDDGKS